MGSQINYSQINSPYDRSTLEALLNASLSRLSCSPVQELGVAALRSSTPHYRNFDVERSGNINIILELMGRNRFFPQNQNSLNSETTGNLLNSRTLTTLPSLSYNALTELIRNANISNSSPTGTDINRFQHDLSIRKIPNVSASSVGVASGNTTNSSVGSLSSLDRNLLTEFINNNTTKVLSSGANESGLQIQDRRMRENLQMGARTSGSGANVFATVPPSSNLSNIVLPELPVNAPSNETVPAIEISNLQMQDPRMREILGALQANRYNQVFATRN